MTQILQLQTSASQNPEPAVEFPNLTVLVVDDDLGDRKHLRRLISGCGLNVEVTEVDSVEAAFSHRSTDFDAVFLDHYLPGFHGLDCLDQFREYWPRSAIILVTSQGDETLAKLAIQSGANDYIAKMALCENAVSRMLSNGVRRARRNWYLEEQRRDLTQFSEVLLHDFKAPIRAAAFLSEQIAEDLDTGDLDEVREGLRMLRKSARQMMDMVAGLADHVRLDREIVHAEVTPEEIVDRALTAVAVEVRESGAQIDVNCPSGRATVACNAPQIAQVLQNLIANAIKYSGDAVPEISLTVAPDDKARMQFEVRDNGIGIAEEYRDRVFEPFKRVPGNASVEGTGLGLATCKKFVVRHGGRIWCEPADGGGTVFRFVIPIAQARP